MSNPTTAARKRERDPDDTLLVDGGHEGSPPSTNSSVSTTNFRNANVRCVGFDPVSKREIPRSYVYYLETRVNTLEALLRAHNLPYPPPSDDFAISDAIKPGINVPYPPQDEDAKPSKATLAANGSGSTIDPALREPEKDEKVDKLVSNIGMVSVQGTSDLRHHYPMSGIPFARVMQAAVKHSVSQTPSEKGSSKPSKPVTGSAASGGSGGSDSFFGLNTKPAAKPAPFPDKAVGVSLVELFFEYSNPQIPVLHRTEFMDLVERIYNTDPKKRTARELYFLNIVFAIGSGIIMDTPNAHHGTSESTPDLVDVPPERKRQRISGEHSQPEEYHAAAIVHLDGFMGSPPAAQGAIGGIEELQAVLLLAGLALLRPVAPGLWYIIGIAVRLAVDLGLHIEDIDPDLDSRAAYNESGEVASRSFGRRQWARDLRRRLWWCVYSFDRLVSTCVGRPVGVIDQIITTEFPSLLSDTYITTSGFVKPPNTVEPPSYKFVAHHYFRLRLLQSEILQVLQHRHAEQARAMGANRENDFMHTDLPCPFLANFPSFREWRVDVDSRLWEWKRSAPQKSQTGVAFTPLFFELNYWQAIILLYRQSLAVPEPLAGELSPATGGDVQSPSGANVEAKEDEEMVFMKVAQAGQTVLKIYRQLHRLKLVNYTFLATHHLFMSGKGSLLSLDDVDFTVLIAYSVLTDLMEKCPPAEACRDAFMRMSKATISMVMSTTGFGNASTLGSQPLNSPRSYFGRKGGRPHSTSPSTSQAQLAPSNAQMPQFDLNLKDLFSEEEIANRPITHPPNLQNFPTSRQTGGHSSSFGTGDMSQSNSEAPAFANSSPRTFSGSEPYDGRNQPANSSYPMANEQHEYRQPFDQTLSQTDFTADDLGFLDTFPIGVPNTNPWMNGNDLDLGYGTGGTGFDGNGAWEANGGVDLFDGFFFGNGSGF
ncbi:MAG: hypothetical protein FE78DRAFT_26839 [Acidomyces sp. 'richmondensis']|nr:MAG: hypothetical protein FE78DRAFT_26839 [Acidomyces sp. 'richmondensis']